MTWADGDTRRERGGIEKPARQCSTTKRERRGEMCGDAHQVDSEGGGRWSDAKKIGVVAVPSLGKRRLRKGSMAPRGGRWGRLYGSSATK
jgi:hypothetical protein